MATKKVKKFGRGGDILTGLGAGILGYAAYKKLTEGKGQDDSKATESSSRNRDEDSGASTKKPRISEEVEKAQGNKIEDRKEYVAADDEENKAKKTALAGGMRYKKPEVSAAVDTSDNAPVVKKVVKKADDKKVSTDKAPPFKGEGMAGSTTQTQTTPVLRGGESKVEGEGKLKPYPANLPTVKEAERRKYLEKKITTPGTAKAGDKSGSTQKGRSENPIQGTIDNAGKSMARTPEQKMGERAREVQRRREEEMKSRYKKGGAVKKYASGGSVSSASKRADGIAMRGKTRGKVC